MSNPVPIPKIEKCIEIFGSDKGPYYHSTLSRIDFRSATTLKQQLDFLKNTCPELTVRIITKLLGISNNRYYASNIGSDKIIQNPLPPPSRQLLFDEEEKGIIQFILHHQIENNCLTGKEIRLAAAQLYKARTGSEKYFTRDWLHDFKTRHQDSIEKVIACALDDERSNISPDDVERYITSIEKMMEDPPNPFLLINFDETGFGKRPEKGKRKKVYVVKSCHVKPYFREETDQNHISVVVGITAACSDITPLFLSNRKRLDQDLNDTFFFRRANYFSTPKGYMTIESTIFWVENNLAPYVKCVRDMLGENLRCVVIADGLSSHFHERIQPSLECIGNIEMIPLPAHSSHIAQMLDVSILNSFKTMYKSIPGEMKFSSPFTKKIMRIKKAYQSVMFDEQIRAGWETAGFKIAIENGDVVSYTFEEGFKEFLRSQALHQDQSENQ